LLSKENLKSISIVLLIFAILMMVVNVIAIIAISGLNGLTPQMGLTVSFALMSVGFFFANLAIR
jgi:hypothetical protein